MRGVNDTHCSCKQEDHIERTTQLCSCECVGAFRAGLKRCDYWVVGLCETTEFS